MPPRPRPSRRPPRHCDRLKLGPAASLEVSDTASLAVYLAGRLTERKDDIVNEWVGWIRDRMTNPAVEALSFQGLLNHIPPVIESLGDYLINPTYAVRAEILGHLRMHGQMRRDQGYDVRDVMAELDGLSHLVTRTLRAELDDSGESWSLEAALTVFERLAAGLRAMAFVTVSVYRDTEDDRRQELARRLAEFGRTIGHELRTPLHSISLSAELLSDSDLAADDVRRRQQLDVIRSAVKHAEGLLYDIDLLAMVEGAHSGARMSPLPAVLEAVREEMAARAQGRDVSLDFVADPPRLAVETVVAQLAITNLVSNSVKYCDPEKDERWVRVEAEELPGADCALVRVTVTDNGLGIPYDYHARVFQRHFRGHPEVAEGTGLGLAITRELVEECGGSVEVESEDGKGTTMRITLRAIDAESIDALTRYEQPEGMMQAAVRALMESDRPPPSDDEQ